MVLLTRDAVLSSIGSIVVALVTRTYRGLPTEVELGRRQGLPTRSVVNVDNLMTIPRDRLKYLMGSLDSEKEADLNQAIKTALALP